MTTTDELMQEYMSKAYTPYGLKGETFTIVEDIPRGKHLRECRDLNDYKAKNDKNYLLGIKTGAIEKDLFYLIGIESGIIQKDLKLTPYEYIEFMLTCPKNIENMRGITARVDEKKRILYQSQTFQAPPISTISQAMAPTTPAPLQSAPITQPEQNQADKFTGQFLNNITLANKFGKVDTKVLLNLAEDIVGKSNALDLVATTKTKGLITEKDGTYVVV